MIWNLEIMASSLGYDTDSLDREFDICLSPQVNTKIVPCELCHDHFLPSPFMFNERDSRLMPFHTK